MDLSSYIGGTVVGGAVSKVTNCEFLKHNEPTEVMHGGGFGNLQVGPSEPEAINKGEINMGIYICITQTDYTQIISMNNYIIYFTWYILK